MTTTAKKPARTKPEAKKGEAAPPPKPEPSDAEREAISRATVRLSERPRRVALRTETIKGKLAEIGRPIRIPSDGLPPVAAAGTGELLRAHPEVRPTATPAMVTPRGKPFKSAGLFAPHSASAETGRLRWLISVSLLPPPPLAPRANRGAPLSRGPLQPRASWGEGLSGATMPLRADEVIE